MLRNSRTELLVALVLVAPFLAIYLLAFVYPTVQMLRISFTDAPLIGEGQWIGLDNYLRLDNDPMFRRAAWNTAYFVLMTVIPGTIIALLIALGVGQWLGSDELPDTRIVEWIGVTVFAGMFALSAILFRYAGAKTDPKV